MCYGGTLDFKENYIDIINTVKEYDMDAVMVFIGRSRELTRKKLNKEEINDQLMLLKQDTDIKNIVVHSPFYINLANRSKLFFNLDILGRELRRARDIGADYFVIHPGYCRKDDMTRSINNVASTLNKILSSSYPIVCLEHVAGQGNELGYTLGQLQAIIARVKRSDKIGVCLDTCHLYAAGYDIKDNLDGVIKDIKGTIGLDRVKVIHVNGSVGVLNSKLDIHANIDSPTDKLGLKAIKAFCSLEEFKDIPKVLETPYINGKNRYVEELEMLRS